MKTRLMKSREELLGVISPITGVLLMLTLDDIERVYIQVEVDGSVHVAEAKSDHYYEDGGNHELEDEVVVEDPVRDLMIICTLQVEIFDLVFFSLGK